MYALIAELGLATSPTECSSDWNGYMEGAVRSGEAAARTVLAELGADPRR